MNQNKFGYNLYKIRKLRIINSFTLEDVATILDLTKQGYMKKENGLRKFTLEEAKKLAELYEVSIEKLFFSNTSNQNVNTTTA